MANSILLIGESGVGKTHYGAQLLKRLMNGDGALRMNGAATNLEPFEAALVNLNEGKAADHTPTATYVDSVWPVSGPDGKKADLVWPDYGGEQIKAMSTTRRIPAMWRDRVLGAPSWLLLLRLQQTRLSDDILSRPLQSIQSSNSGPRDGTMSDQARLIELLQILLYLRGAISSAPVTTPRLCILLSCWDELHSEDRPDIVFQQRLPMLANFVRSTWASPDVLGLSALERSLNARDSDPEYAARGPEQFGFVILPDGMRSTDLTLPIQRLLDRSL